LNAAVRAVQGVTGKIATRLELPDNVAHWKRASVDSLA
jgi:hypothetical protein